MYSQARRRVLISIAVTCVAVGVWLLWPVLMHRAAQAIVASRQAIASKGAPDFTLKDTRGKRVRLSDFKGQVVVLNFWATWCGPCKTEIPWFIDFQKQWQARGFTVLGVSMDEDGWKAIDPYVAEKKINYPVVLADERVNEAYGGIEALPTTLIVGRDGKVRFIHSGLIARADYEKEIQQLL
ncbi:MAG: TlpA family protein disulfide reductase [Acidobacteriota bacterium]|nr:TlpA family protein disulfide reductase [Acidobacteriota bacterium]